MKRLVLNIVCPMKSSDSGGALVYPDRREGLRACYPSTPLFLRDVGRYYWDRKSFETEYKLSVEECVKNELGRTFVFFDTSYPLFESVRQGNIKMVKYLARKGADIHYWNEDALVRACWRGHFEIVKFLVENGAVIHADKNKALRCLCSKNYSQIHDEKNKGLRWVHNRDFFEMVKYLIDRIEQAQINHAFLIIVYHGYFELAKYLIRKGADIHAENDSALWCASHGHLEIVKYLVRHGADVHTHNELPLIEAVLNNNLEIVKYLVRHGADVHARQDYALREACAEPFFGPVRFLVVKFLVENGADVHAQNDYALRLASQRGNLEVVKFLVANRADVHAENEYAVRLASENGHREVTEFLIQHGAVLPPE